jgi:hypothetical protein
LIRGRGSDGCNRSDRELAAALITPVVLAYQAWTDWVLRQIKGQAFASVGVINLSAAVV